MQLKQDKALSLLGLAAKAGKVASGEFSVEKEVKGGRAYLVVAAKDASDNTKKALENVCSNQGIPLVFYSKKEELGHAIGKQFRVSAAVLDQGFAKAIVKQITT